MSREYDQAEIEAVAKRITRERVLLKRLEWNNLCAAGLIDQEELRLISLYDHKPIEQKVTFYRDNAKGYAGLFFTLIGGGKNVTANVDRAQYGLALIDEILDAEPTGVKYFLQLQDPWTPLLRLMQTKNDPFCSALSVKLVSLFILRSTQLPEGIVEEVLRWCNDKLRTLSDIEIALEGLQTLLRQDDIRVRFFEEDGLNRIGGIIKNHNSDTTILYKALYCIWVMSYNKHIASQFHKTTLIHHVVEIMRNVQKEKIIRVCIAILANIANKGERKQNNHQMIEAKISRVLDNINQKKWADDDLNADLEFLTEVISKDIGEMSSWDAYKTELQSGSLEWGPVHTSDRFWRENIKRFEDNNFEALGILIGILRNSQNAQNLQIACHDVGEFIRFHPIGKQIVSKMDGKYVVMRHMEHPNPEVQKEALLCTQKLLVVSWDSLK